MLMMMELEFRGNITLSSGDLALSSYTILSRFSCWSSPRILTTTHLKNSPLKVSGIVTRGEVMLSVKSSPSVAVVRLERTNSKIASLPSGWSMLAEKQGVELVKSPLSGSKTASRSFNTTSVVVRLGLAPESTRIIHHG